MCALGISYIPYINFTYITDTNSTPASMQIGGNGSYNMGFIPKNAGNKITLTVVHQYGANQAMTLFQTPDSSGYTGTGIVIDKPGMYAFDAGWGGAMTYNYFTISSGGSASGHAFSNDFSPGTMQTLNLSGSNAQFQFRLNGTNRKICLIVKTLTGTITTGYNNGSGL